MPRTRRRPSRNPAIAAAWLAIALVGSGCSGSDGPTGATYFAPIELPTEVLIPVPGNALTDLALVEDASEEVADRLLNFSDKIRRRDFTAAREWFAPTFHGHSFVGLDVLNEREEHLGVAVREWDASTAPIVGGAAFFDGLAELLGPWSRIESAIWKVKGAEFERARSPWGRIKIYVHITGQHEGGGGVALSGWGWARVERRDGQWLVQRFELTSLSESRRAGPVFSNVSTSAGVAHTGIRFGQPGNDSFAFNGAAAGDVDGDGRWDVFVPSDGRNFLYLANADGTFREEAVERGVAQPDAGTGTVFFDFDNDGDQDLAVGHVGWLDGKGALQGNTLQLYVNDGEGHFEAKSAELGLDVPLDAFSLTVLDHDLDGWLDLYVCGYGRVDNEHNDSWIEATNGSPNALFRNLEGKGFEDVAAEAGVRGARWSYASASADVDGDGDPDLYVSNDYGSNNLYLNEGDGRFTDVAPEYGVTDRGNGMGISFGDLSNDGRLDIYGSNMSSTAGNRILDRLQDQLAPEVYAALKKAAAGNTIFTATDDGFEALPSSAGGVNASWAWASALCDFDLDGRLDVFCTNGFVTGDLPQDT